MGKPTQLIRLPEANLRRQEGLARRFTRIQFPRIRHDAAITIRHRRLADAGRELLRRVGCDLREGHVGGGGGGGEEVVDGPLPPFEGGVVLGDLAGRGESVPGVDLDGEGEGWEDGEGEVEAVGRGL